MSKPRTGAPKRVAVGLLAGALAMFGVALAPPAGAAASVSNERLAGATRYGTAAAIAGDEAFAAPTTAIVATGENFPDALAASSLAGANAQAPIILTQTGTYTTEAKAGLAALKAKGVTALTIVGGTVAVSQAVEDAIKADGFTVSRVAGDDRYETAAAIATAANTKSPSAAIGTPALKTGLFATGLNFPDALAGGPAAYANKLPLLLVNDGVPAETANAISTLGIKKAVILGGTSAVSTTVEAALVAATGNPATRLAGINRYSTAAAIGDYEIATLAFPATAAVLATGVNFPDALAAGPLGGQLKAPIVLTASLPEESRAFLDKYSSTIQKLYVSGGTSAIDDATVAAAEAAAETVSNDSANKAVTTRPDLTGAAIVETVAANQETATKLQGTYVRYTFDETLGAFAPVAGFFHLYNASSATAIDGTTASVETTAPATGNSVLVRFAGLNTATSTADLAKATVDFEAVRDASGAGNPEGDAPVGIAGTTTTGAGSTSAPDLVSVTNFRAASTATTTAVDFTFDQVANVATTSGFHLVDTQNGRVDCTSSSTPSTGGGTTTVAGGSGTTTITVICPNASNGTTLRSASTVARGYVEAGSVATGLSGSGVTNPVQAADVTANSLGPDLVSVSVSTASLGSTPSARSVAIFTFDTAVSHATSSRFHLYQASGAVLDTIGTDAAGGCTTATVNNDSSNGFTCTINSSNPTQVRVVFGPSTTVVGGYVDGDGTGPNSAVNTANTGAFQYNQVDEEGSSSAASVTRVPGRNVGPDLVSVALSAATDAFGNASGFRATYTFDAAITPASPAAANFYLYFSDGTRYRAGTCFTGAGDGVTATTVTCQSYVNATTNVAPSPAATGVGPSVLGTVDNGAVTSNTGTFANTEAAAPTTGGSGTPAS